jgi:broad specificity phosphatase PhoE
MTETRLILVRHGHTASNGSDPDPRLSGWTDLPLSSLGWRQVEALRSSFLYGPRVDIIYSSPLRRACDTAQELVRASQRELRILQDLREINCGEVDGLPIREVRRLYARQWEENNQQNNSAFRWPGGESYQEMRERSLGAIQTIASAHPGQDVLVVTHAGLISQVLGSLQGTNPARWELFRPGNASLTELEWGAHGGRLVTFDDRRHLGDLG